MKNYNTPQTHEKGFAIPIVLLLSLTVIAFSVALLQTASILHQRAYDSYYTQLADEAAESGIAFAQSCLAANEANDYRQTWTNTKKLTPQTDCNGNIQFTYQSYLDIKMKPGGSNTRLRFEVGDLDYQKIDPTVSQISSTGYFEFVDPSGTVKKTYTSVVKKNYIWPRNTQLSSITVGLARMCGVVVGKPYCWGDNSIGQLGNGTTDNTAVTAPVRVLQEDGVLAGRNVIKISAGVSHTCAVTSDGKLFCWGGNGRGQLGTFSYASSSKPVQVKNSLVGKFVTDVATLDYSTCAIADGKIYCWGQNYNGELGTPNVSGTYPAPRLVDSGNLPWGYNATYITKSGFTACAIVNGKAYCWGDNSGGQLGGGQPTSYKAFMPEKVDDTGLLAGKTISSIALDGFSAVNGGNRPYVQACATTTDGKLYCWGDNAVDQFQKGDPWYSDFYTRPTTVWESFSTNHSLKQVELTIGGICALATDNNIYCSGWNADGKLGINKDQSQVYVSSSPQAVFKEPGVLKGVTIDGIYARGLNACAYARKSVYCWGNNSQGEVGDGTTIDRIKPTEVLFLKPTPETILF